MMLKPSARTVKQLLLTFLLFPVLVPAAAGISMPLPVPNLFVLGLYASMPFTPVPWHFRDLLQLPIGYVHGIEWVLPSFAVTFLLTRLLWKSFTTPFCPRQKMKDIYHGK